MKYEETCTKGSFSVWGSGFRFDYKAQSKLLNIVPLHEKRILVHLQFDEHLAKTPLAYIEILEKTNQINALMYSNNATLNLAEIMEGARIASLIETSVDISRRAYDLKTMNFERFADHFRHYSDLKNVNIKKFTCSRQENEFYLARIQTHRDNSVCVRACTLSGLTAALSERMLHDLIAMELGRYNNNARHLLHVSTKLSTISRIVDENFIPQHKLAQYEKLRKQMDTATTKPYENR
jgi:hypothetical protein